MACDFYTSHMLLGTTKLSPNAMPTLYSSPILMVLLICAQNTAAHQTSMAVASGVVGLDQAQM